MIRYFMWRQFENESYLESHIEEEVLFEGMIVEETQDTETAQKIIVDISRIADRSPEHKIKVIISAPFYPRFEYGDYVSVLGIVKKPEAFESNGRSFDYPSFLAKDRIYYKVNSPTVTVIAHDKGSPVTAILFKIKRSFVKHIESVVPRPESSLLGGYLVEGKQSLSKNLQEEFKTVGVIHTVALSGYNVTVIVQGVMKLLSFLTLRFQLIGGAGAIILFTVMTGASATVVRAAIMALVAMSGQALGRSYNVFRALVLAAFVMTVWNPMTLVFDPSFQLSFLATLGLIFLSPIITPRLAWISEKFKLRETITSTLSAQLAVLPFILYSSGSLSIVALPANIIILPQLPFTMFLGGLTGFLSFISNTISIPFAGIVYLMLHIQLGLVHFFSRMPFAAISVPFPPWLAILIYLITCLWLLRNYLRSLSN